MRRVATVLAALSLALAACGDTDGDGDADLDPVAAAEQRVTRAEDDLSEAQTSFDEASEQLCGDATDYVEAVDRYGRLFTDAEATVGDVTTAGRDLAEPEGDVDASADAATAAREGVAEAEAELADARAALAEAQAAAGSSTTAPEEVDVTSEPVVAAASVERVAQAQEEMDAAFEGIAEDTTLTDAGEEVNAAAFALEIAWLRILADAGCLTDEQRATAVDEVTTYTTSLQTALTTAGFYDGEIDGVYGAGTVDAVKQLQTDSGLPATGFVDQATASALSDLVAETAEASGEEALAHTAAVQSVLALAGYWTGPIDGEWTDALTAAVEELQADLGVPVTGVVDPATLAAVQDAIAAASEAAATTTTEVDEGEDATTTTSA